MKAARRFPPGRPTGHVSRVPERMVSPFAYPGVQIVHPRLFDDAPQRRLSPPTSCGTAPSPRTGCYGMRLDGVWIHVGTPEARDEAEAFLAPGW